VVDKAIKNGINRKTYNTRRFHGWSKERASTEAINRYKGDFAIYRRGEILISGTAEECAAEMGVTVEYIKWMTTPSAQKRMAARKSELGTTAVKLDLEDDEG